MTGTPKTLTEAIQAGITATAAAYLETGAATSASMRAAIKDFMAQQVQISLLQYDDNDGRLMELFNRLTKE